MTQQRRFIQCDVFTSTPARGNALAVVLDGEGLSDERMQAFAAWLHAGGVARENGVVRQECGVGIVEIDQRGTVPAFVAPPTAIDALPEKDSESIVAALGLDPGSIVRTAKLKSRIVRSRGAC